MSTPPMDPYKILGVPMDAQLADIRTAHRKLVLKCHPDKVADPALKVEKQNEFQKVQQAYEVLIDEEQRARVDDLLKLHSTRERVAQHNKANSSAPRSSPSMYREFEIRTADPSRSRSYREPSSRDVPPSFVPPNVKIFSYTRGSSRDPERGPRYYEDGRPPRRGESYSEKPSKRESERESQREREKREDKERRKEKDRRKLEREREREDERTREKAAKKEAKRQREKQEAKEKKRDKEDKRRERDGGAYIEPSDDEILHKKSSSRKYDTRERSSGRDEPPPSMRRSQTDGPQMGSSSSKINSARAYIHRAQTSGPPDRSNSYHPRDPQPPAAPTPPPAPSGAFVAPEEDDVRRSSARPRRGSADIPSSMPRERTMHRSSREPVEEDPVIVNASPAANRTRYTTAPLSESPPRGPVRTNTMPVNEKPSRGMPGPRRAQTYSEGPEVAGNRGRGRSKMYAQAEVLSESEDDYDEPPRRPKHRSSRKERSPARGQEIRYHVADGRTKLHSSSSYSRSLPQKQPAYAHYDYEYEPARSPQTSRPEYSRAPSYSSVNFGKFRQGPSYNTHDVAYSHFDPPTHGHYAEERPVYA